MGLMYHQEAFKDASVHSLWALQRLLPNLWSAVKEHPFLDAFLSPSGWQMPWALWCHPSPS